MDAGRFDALTRSLTLAGSRRALAGLLSGTLGLVGAWAEETAAKNCKKIKNRKKRKKCLQKATPRCVPTCAASKPCGSDGCGGSCGSCVAPETCQSGQCRCTPDCKGKTCGDDGCGGSCGPCTGGTCDAGQCICSKPFEEVVCQGACVADCQQSTPGEMLDPETCRCCLDHNRPCGGGSKPCCSGTCRTHHAGGDACEGRNGGEACTWGGQCRTGFCDAGTCSCDGEYCNGVCRSPCLVDGHGRQWTRDWETCGCCLGTSVSCSGSPQLSSSCCSSTCDPGTGCRGRPAGALCTFDAQCANGRCDYRCSSTICTAEKRCL